MRRVVRGFGGLTVLGGAGLVALFAWGGVALIDFPGMPSAYEAKEYCSCRFVSGMDEDFCEEFVHQTVVPSQGRTVDEEAKSVTARALWTHHTARWVDARQGCVLED